MASTRSADQVGRVLDGRYRLLGRIGTGASADVFLADDARLQRRVAVKLLHPALADDAAFLRRFEAEAVVVARLSHPNVMAVYDWGEEDGSPYLVCEYLAGGSLRTLLDRGQRLTPSQALLVGLQAARGLDYAHRRGLVHRDVKPANLLFDDDERLRIGDFGVARALAEAAWTEPAGAVLGTARYASPEQARGVTLDGKSDVYSLAVVLVEAVTGVVPFAADTTIAMLMARVDRPLPVPDELGPLQGPLEQAGQNDPDVRPTAAELTAALEAAARALPAPAPLPLARTDVVDEPVVVDTDPTVVVTAPEEIEAADEPPLRRRLRVSRRWVIGLLLGLAVLLAAGAAAFALARSSLPSHPLVDVRGKTEPEARFLLRPLNVHVDVRREYADGTVVGRVLDETPRPGQQVKEQSDVRLVVSKGPTPVAVPDLRGLTQTAAQARLQGLGLGVGKVVTRPDEVAVAGQVLDSNPKGTTVPRGGTVDLVVSSGPTPRVVPADLKGKSFDDAKVELAALGLTAVRVDGFSDDVQVGQVASSSPPAGASVPKGAQVTLTVSKGPATVVVPSVRGMTVDAATAAMAGAGLQVNGVFGPDPVHGHVVYTNPPAGAKVKRGSAVVLYTG